MKGQFIFEFLIAGLIFFTLIVYTINYLNVNVSDFKSKFYYNRLQSKAVQISEILMGEKSTLSLVEDSRFSMAKIQDFNNSYCRQAGDYAKLIDDLYLKERTTYGLSLDNDVKIYLSSPNEILLLDCPGIITRSGSPRAEIERLGVLQGVTVKLRVIVW
jgi:hypothetical protein